MGNKDDKTNVMRVLDQKKVPYRHYSYEGDGTLTGGEVAALLGLPAARVFKTLVTVGKSGHNYVFVIPVEKELSLKLAARAVGEKNIEMIPARELLPLTGYIHGGCSPIGMKKQFPTAVDASAESFETIYFSGGRIGRQVEVAPKDLLRVVPVQFCPLTE